jgi:hypothetical protein
MHKHEFKHKHTHLPGECRLSRFSARVCFGIYILAVLLMAEWCACEAFVSIGRLVPIGEVPKNQRKLVAVAMELRVFFMES